MLPLAARAQQAGKVWRIGFISGASRATVSEILDGFPQGMRELGYAEGKDFTIEWRFADGIYERFPGIAAELVRLKVDVIVLGTPAAVRPVQQATATIPIVMGYSTDPVGNGFVTNLARPGGHITGLASSLVLTDFFDRNLFRIFYFDSWHLFFSCSTLTNFFSRQAMDVSWHFNGIFMLIVRIFFINIPCHFSAVYSNLGSAKQH